MNLERALCEISAIKSQIGKTETFRGFKSLTVGMSGVVGFWGALCQAQFVAEPTQNPIAYVLFWSCLAALNVAIVGIELAWYSAGWRSPLHRKLTCQAVQQFLPCVGVGGLLTGVVLLTANESARLLPGLWGILFSLGIFATCRLLPWQTVFAGFYYLAAGCLCLSVGQGTWAFSPWLMAITFGGGQLLTAAILYLTLEYRDDTV